MINVSQVIKIPLVDHGGFYVSLGLPPVPPRVPAWIPTLTNC